MERIGDTFVYLVDLPDGINEMVLPCVEGHTIYIDARLDAAHRQKAYEHAMWHIEHEDFQKRDIHRIEVEAHQAIEQIVEQTADPKPTEAELKLQKILKRRKRRTKKLRKQLEEYEQFVEMRLKCDEQYYKDHYLF